MSISSQPNTPKQSQIYKLVTRSLPLPGGASPWSYARSGAGQRMSGEVSGTPGAAKAILPGAAWATASREKPAAAKDLANAAPWRLHWGTSSDQFR